MIQTTTHSLKPHKRHRMIQTITHSMKPRERQNEPDNNPLHEAAQKTDTE